MRTYKTEGIIIKRRNVGETDRILTVFTKDEGKIQVKAKGVRKITSRRASHVELLNYGMLTLYKGSKMPILTEIETMNAFQVIKTDLSRIGFGYHICELIDGLCPEAQENRKVFFLLQEVLDALSTKENIAIIIHEFEVELLTHLGYWSQGKYIPDGQTLYMIESILERRLKARKFIHQLQ